MVYIADKVAEKYQGFLKERRDKRMSGSLPERMMGVLETYFRDRNVKLINH